MSDRQIPFTREPSERIRDFSEVNLGFDKEKAALPRRLSGKSQYPRIHKKTRRKRRERGKKRYLRGQYPPESLRKSMSAGKTVREQMRPRIKRKTRGYRSARTLRR